MHERLISHCIQYNLISDRQAAYLKGDSTITQLIYLVHQIRTTWGKSKISHGLFLDISAAFDKVWHKGLLAKLDQIGTSGSFFTLFREGVKNTQRGGAHKSRDLRSPICDPP